MQPSDDLDDADALHGSVSNSPFAQSFAEHPKLLAELSRFDLASLVSFHGRPPYRPRVARQLDPPRSSAAHSAGEQPLLLCFCIDRSAF
jgi:hypothetical protein